MPFRRYSITVLVLMLFTACSRSGNMLLPSGIIGKNAARCTNLATENSLPKGSICISGFRSEPAPSSLILVEPDMNRFTW